MCLKRNTFINLVIVAVTIKYFVYVYYLLMESNNCTSVMKNKLVSPSPIIFNKSMALKKTPNAVISMIMQKIERINSKQKVYNEDIFGHWLYNDSIVIIIQVHDRITYLRHLIQSLSEVDGISNALLIFSHDHYSEVMNVLVRNIHYCKVMQIFYPHSLQIYPMTFPGNDRLDCPIKEDFVTFQNKHCYGSYDCYGNLREPTFCQMKHHWWWSMVRVFHELNITRNYSGLVAYLEEDNYILKDFLYVLKLMHNTSIALYPEVNVFSLRTPWFSNRHRNYHDEISIDTYVMQGVVFNRTTWNKIKNCSKFFCFYDDYNWDWSLYNVATKCTPLTAMSVKLPRIYHIGLCGMHGRLRSCRPWVAVKKVRSFFDFVIPRLFPEELILIHDNPQVANVEKPYGGWGDIRDHNLCMSMIDTYV